MDLGWVVAGILALVCVFLVYVIEKAYSTGINVGRTEVLEEEIVRLKAESDAADRMGRAIG